MAWIIIRLVKSIYKGGGGGVTLRLDCFSMLYFFFFSIQSWGEIFLRRAGKLGGLRNLNITRKFERESYSIIRMRNSNSAGSRILRFCTNAKGL